MHQRRRLDFHLNWDHRRQLVDLCLLVVTFLLMFFILYLSLRALDIERENRIHYNIHYQQEMDALDPHRFDMPPPSESLNAWKKIQPTGDWE